MLDTDGRVRLCKLVIRDLEHDGSMDIGDEAGALQTEKNYPNYHA
jgi:hypothetical protein